jgi:hypothetical protein
VHRLQLGGKILFSPAFFSSAATSAQSLVNAVRSSAHASRGRLFQSRGRVDNDDGRSGLEQLRRSPFRLFHLSVRRTSGEPAKRVPNASDRASCLHLQEKDPDPAINSKARVGMKELAERSLGIGWQAASAFGAKEQHSGG